MKHGCLDVTWILNPARKLTAQEQDTTTRSEINEAAPIGRLPPELLAKALEFRGSDKDLISATHVCSRWRSALTTAPPLWTEVVFQDPNRALTYLTRSGALPIGVSIGTRSFDPEDFYTSRIPWFDRVQSMELRGDEVQIEAIARRLYLPVPLLRNLKLNGKVGWNSVPWEAPGTVHPPHEFFGGQAPSLRNLSVDFISPPLIAKFPLANLTSLTWIDKRSRAAVEFLLPVLALAPSLELLTLSLRKLYYVSDAEWTMNVSLNELRELTWSNCAGAFSLTSCLVTPKLRRLTMETRHTDLASTLPPYKGYFPLLVEPTEIRYDTSENGTRVCEFRSPTSYVRVTTTHRNYKLHILQFLRDTAAISFKRVKQMTIKLDSPPLLDDHVPDVGEPPTELFESLETLELVDGRNNDFTLIRPRFHEPTPVVPFPALLEVRTTPGANAAALAGLAEILKERKQAGRGVKTVRIEGRCDEATNEVVAKIRESVGEVVLQ